MTVKKAVNPHSGHRESVKKRFLDEGLDHFEKHQILEMILFYAIPRIDVNALAHDLITRFGSFSGVLDATYEELCQVPGIGKQAATLLKMFPAVAKCYFQDRFSSDGEDLNYNKLGEELVLHFAGLDHEEVYALFYNNSMRLVGKKTLHEGDINSAGFSLRKLANSAVVYKASFVVIAHNHPWGMPIASADDLHTTKVIEHFLAQMNVSLIDHYIIAENRFTSVDKDHFFYVTEDFKESRVSCGMSKKQSAR